MRNLTNLSGKLMKPTLAVKNLTKRFGGITAINRVSLEVYPGEVIGLVGENGAGKSTLIKIIAGVYKPDEGQIFFEGKECNFNSPLEARKMGIETVYQDLALAENLDVSSNIFLGREPVRPFLGGLAHVLDRRYMVAEAKKVLEQLGITIPNLESEIRKLSSGQRQAVAIARAIYWQAKLMLMDEPTASLGASAREKVLSLVRALREHGVPVIFVSQNLGDVFAVSDRIIILRRGEKVGERLVSETNPEEIASLIRETEAVESNYPP